MQKVLTVKERRLRLKVDGETPTQEQVARLLDVTLGSWNGWERHNRIPTKRFRVAFLNLEKQYGGVK
jgi:hypothetical protein